VKHPIYVVAAATACCLPMLPGLLSGAISADTAGTRLLIALVVCWVLGSILSSVLHRYSAQARHDQMIKVIEEVRGNTRPPGQTRAE
jgi:hypothetical protein